MAAVLELSHGVKIPLSAVGLEFSRGGGPGGQNVNKVNSRVTARIDLRTAPGIPDAMRARLLAALGSRLTTAGELLVHAAQHRDQGQNREAALARLAQILEKALHVPKSRKATRPTRGSVERRIKNRKARSALKKSRRWKPED